MKKTIAIVAALTTAILNILLSVPKALMETIHGLDPVLAVSMAAALLLSSGLIILGVADVLEARS